jgi:hypothetical protein
MNVQRVVVPFLASAIVAVTGAIGVAKDDKPSISVKANPSTGFAPLRTVLTAEVKGGADDYEPFYCPTIEWDLGDGTKAEQQGDCDPYEAGKSTIKRRYVREQVFDYAGDQGELKVQFRLKQKNKVVGAGNTVVRVRPGLRDIGGEREAALDCRPPFWSCSLDNLESHVVRTPSVNPVAPNLRLRRIR